MQSNSPILSIDKPSAAQYDEANPHYIRKRNDPT